LALASVVSGLVALAAFAQATPSRDDSSLAWTPPKPRKEMTPFAPKPLGGRNLFKGEAEIWLADAVQEVEGGIFTPIKDQAVIDYVSQVGAYVASHSVEPTKQYKFVVTTDTDPDAMSVGAGRIYITIGMLRLMENEDELAGVLAHEIGHDAFHHPGKDVTRQMFWMTGTMKIKSREDVKTNLQRLLAEYEKKPLAAIGERMLGFSRFNELEADRAAFYDTYKAGYNPRALSSILKRYDDQEKKEIGQAEYNTQQILIFLFGSHPPTPQRTTAIWWEGLFLKMPPRVSLIKSPAFDAMKARLASVKSTT
jgi:predicted Zn-dependent protease